MHEREDKLLQQVRNNLLSPLGLGFAQGNFSDFTVRGKSRVRISAFRPRTISDLDE